MKQFESGTTASKIATFLGKDLKGEDIQIKRASSLSSISRQSVSFIKTVNENNLQIANKNPEALFIVPISASGLISAPHIIVDNPRHAFGLTLGEFFEDKATNKIADSAIIDSNAIIGKNVSIGEYCVIGPNVTIGDNCELRHHVTIVKNTKMGANTIVKSQTVIGDEGFAIEKDAQGNNNKIPHIGGVIIGENVFIGAGCVIARGTLDSTSIDDFTKIDDAVKIAHNVRIGKNCIITPSVEVAGSVTIGDNVWLGPSSAIVDGVSIGNNALIGIGTVVIRDCDADFTYFGNPAKKIGLREV